MNPTRTHLALAFIVGPLASALLFAVVGAVFGHYQTENISTSETTAAFGALLAGGAAYSYVFTLLFGLPVFLVWVKKKWFSLRHFVAAGAIAGFIGAAAYLVAAGSIAALPFSSAIIVFALVNASAMWLYLRLTYAF